MSSSRRARRPALAYEARRDDLRDLLDLVRRTLPAPALPALALPALALPSLALPALAGGPTRMATEARAVGLSKHAAARPRLTAVGHTTFGGESGAETSYEMDENHQQTWELVVAAQQGDGEAFGKLYDRYVDTVYRFIYFRINDRTLAEDFTSETFLRALRRISTITYQGRDFGAWLVTIARNIVFDHSKSARNRLEMTTGDVIEGNELAPSPESAVIDALTSDKLISGVKQLNAEQRECVELRFIQGLSVSETAAAMGKNDGAIKALQHRAVRKLADLIGNELR
jgi:RNA polymerase sigma-70 factor (ECF subfamily)